MILFQLFRRVAAALPGMDINQDKQNKDDSILNNINRLKKCRVVNKLVTVSLSVCL